MISVPEFVYKPMEDRTEEELRQTIEMQKAAIRKHTTLAKWGNVESKERLRVIRAAKKRAEECLKKF